MFLFKFAISFPFKCIKVLVKTIKVLFVLEKMTLKIGFAIMKNTFKYGIKLIKILR